MHYESLCTNILTHYVCCAVRCVLCFVCCALRVACCVLCAVCCLGYTDVNADMLALRDIVIQRKKPRKIFVQAHTSTSDAAAGAVNFKVRL